jgi:phosphoglycerate dehydrogenase-like enzyme
MALLLTAAKNLIPIERNFRNHDWRDRYAPNPSVLLEGKRALILGYGQIGQKIAQMCLGFGMEVTAIRYSIQSSERDGVVQVHPPPELHKALGSCDILFISLPETSETRGWIGKEEIGRLSDDAILINIARGSIVDERALYEALSLGKLAAAGLDVWYQYPEDQEDRENCPPSAFPFHELDNVVMSPHRAGGWEGSGLGRMDHLIQLLNQAVLGEPLDNRVDLDRGY